MSTPASEAICELCHEELPELAVLTFRRGKARRCCVLCLAAAIQGATGFKVTNVVARMLEARATGPLVSQAYKETQAAFRRAALSSGE